MIYPGKWSYHHQREEWSMKGSLWHEQIVCEIVTHEHSKSQYFGDSADSRSPNERSDAHGPRLPWSDKNVCTPLGDLSLRYSVPWKAPDLVRPSVKLTVCYWSHGTLIVVFPVQDGDSPSFLVCLPEGIFRSATDFLVEFPLLPRRLSFWSSRDLHRWRLQWRSKIKKKKQLKLPEIWVELSVFHVSVGFRVEKFLSEFPDVHGHVEEVTSGNL